jgi:hypothetical protein
MFGSLLHFAESLVGMLHANSLLFKTRQLGLILKHIVEEMALCCCNEFGQ